MYYYDYFEVLLTCNEYNSNKSEPLIFFETAKALNANMSAFSQCGWGICWGWDGNPDSNIAKHYDKVCSLLDGDLHKSLGSTEPYSFGQKMDYVILNLGTNDNSAFVQPVFKDSNGNFFYLAVDVVNAGIYGHSDTWQKITYNNSIKQ